MKKMKRTKKNRYVEKKEPVSTVVDTATTKHLVYFMNIMGEQRVSRYFVVAEGTTGILKTSTEQLCNCIGLWKGDREDQFVQDEEEVMTEFGMRIFRIGEILGAMQSKDPITFWTNGEKERILSVILPMAKDAVKLRRKLTRISDSMIVDLKKLRRLVDIYGCSTSDKNTANLDSNLTEEIDEGIDSVSEFAFNPGSTKAKGAIGSMLTFLRSLFKDKESVEVQSKSNPEVRKDSSFEEATSSNASMKTQFSLNSLDLRTPSQKPSEKQLQKIASTLATPKNVVALDYVLDPLEARIKGVETFFEVEKWKQMDEDRMPPTVQPLERLVSPIVATELSREEFEDIVVEKAPTYFPMRNASQSGQSSSRAANAGQLSTTSKDPQEHQKSKIKNDVEYDRQKYLQKIKSGNQNEEFEDEVKDKFADQLDEFEQQLDSIGIPIQKTNEDAEVPLLDNIAQISEKQGITVIESESQDNQFSNEEHMATYRSIVNEMHDSVRNIIEQVRSLERTWMTTGIQPGMTGLHKLGDLLDFIGKTIELFGQPDLDEQTYPETKKAVLLAIDPVYREAHSCFIALGELAQVVSTDVAYLKELLENLPKGDLIVYEYSSNSSLGSFDQIETSINVNDLGNYSVDLDAIFG